MMFDMMGASVTESASSGLAISAAFTKVLTSAYTPNYGQLSYINPEYIVFLNGSDNTAANSQVVFADSAGVTQDTQEYYANTTGEAIRVKDCCADNDNTYFIGDDAGNDVYIWATSHDGDTIGWGRKLTYSGTAQGQLNIAVTTDYIYFFAGYSGGSTNYVVGQLNKTTGVLLWDKNFGAATAWANISLQADDSAVYLCANSSASGIMAIDTSGTKLWQKVVSSALTKCTGFTASATHVFVSGPDDTAPTKLTALKLLKTTGALSAQVTVTLATPSPGDIENYPQNNSAFGGGKLIFGARSSGGTNPLHFYVSDEDLNIETNALVLTKSGSGSTTTRLRSVAADSEGNWFVTGTRHDNSAEDHFISGVLEDGTVSTGWATAVRTVSTPSYTISNGSFTLSDVTPSANASETVITSSPSNLSTESW